MTVTTRDRRRSPSASASARRPSRETYLDRLDKAPAHEAPTARRCPAATSRTALPSARRRDKAALGGDRVPNLGIITSYNDMLSAHQPFETYPALIKQAAREAGGVAQVAGGVPAMCDGVTQGQPGMELSLFSRDVIAMAAAIGLSHNMFDAAVYLGVCDKIVPGLVIARADLRPPAGGVHSGRPDDHRPAQRREGQGPPALRRGQGRPRRAAGGRVPSPITGRAPAPSTAPPTPTRC